MNDFIFNVLPAQGPIIPTWVPMLGGINIQIVSTAVQIIIAVLALFSVYVVYWVTRFTIGPKLKIEFDQNNPGLCHKTRNSIIEKNKWIPDYYFRFYVENTGKSMAKHCEIIIEKLWFKEAQGQKYERYQRFAPVNLKWTGAKRGIIDINPGRTAIGNIGHIPDIEYQNYLKNKDPFSLIDLGELKKPFDLLPKDDAHLDCKEVGAEFEPDPSSSHILPGSQDETLRFIFDLTQAFYALPNCLAPGDYVIQIGLYSENAKNKKMYLKISWSGKWKNDEKSMFDQIKITEEAKPESW